MTQGMVTHGHLVEASLSNFREHRDAAARWLAVEVLLGDEAALADNDLVNSLHLLQDRLEAQARADDDTAHRLRTLGLVLADDFEAARAEVHALYRIREWGHD